MATALAGRGHGVPGPWRGGVAEPACVRRHACRGPVSPGPCGRSLSAAGGAGWERGPWDPGLARASARSAAAPSPRRASGPWSDVRATGGGFGAMDWTSLLPPQSPVARGMCPAWPLRGGLSCPAQEAFPADGTPLGRRGVCPVPRPRHPREHGRRKADPGLPSPPAAPAWCSDPQADAVGSRSAAPAHAHATTRASHASPSGCV